MCKAFMCKQQKINKKKTICLCTYIFSQFQNVNRHSVVVGSNGKNYYLIEVIALILQKIKIRIQDYFRRRGSITTDTFSWVLTIPALWGESARAMMREAAYLVSSKSVGMETVPINTMHIIITTLYTAPPPSATVYRFNSEVKNWWIHLKTPNFSTTKPVFPSGFLYMKSMNDNKGNHFFSTGTYVSKVSISNLYAHVES